MAQTDFVILRTMHKSKICVTCILRKHMNDVVVDGLTAYRKHIYDDYKTFLENKMRVYK